MINSTEKKNRIEAIVRALNLISRMNKSRLETTESHKIYYQMLTDYYTRLLKSEEESSFVAAHSIFFPVEIFYAMDIVPMHSEVTAWMAALFSGSCADLLAKSAELGLAANSPKRIASNRSPRAQHTFPVFSTSVMSMGICVTARPKAG